MLFVNGSDYITHWKQAILCEFGFNETSLTRALESGNYARAEKIIRDSNNPS